MDPFRVCLAFGPLAMYMLLLGAINLSRRPLLVSGVRDASALAAAVSGMVVIGPLDLIFPVEATIFYGPLFWLLLLGLYVMCVLLCLLMLRPRLVIYNILGDELRPILAEVVDRLDTDARWAGDSLALPGLGVQLYLDGFAAMRTISLTAAGGRQNHLGWRQLEAALESALFREQVGRNPRGIVFIGIGLLLILFVVAAIAQNPQGVALSLLDAVRSVLDLFLAD